MEMEFKSLPMEGDILANSSTTSFMVLPLWNGLMVTASPDNTRRTKKVETGSSCGQMVASMMASGETTRDMVTDSTSLPRAMLAITMKAFAMVMACSLGQMESGTLVSFSVAPCMGQL